MKTPSRPAAPRSLPLGLFLFLAALAGAAPQPPALAEPPASPGASYLPGLPPLDAQRERLFGERGGAFVAAGGLRTHYFDFGDPASGRVLVFLHGFCGTGYEADCLAPGFLEAGYRIVAPDWPGAGLSDALPDTSMESLSAWLDSFREALGLERFALAGHSLGGFLAASYAAAHPDRVSELVLVDPAGFQEEFGGLVRSLADSSLFVDAAAFLYIPWFYELFQDGKVFEVPSRAPEEVLDFAAAALATRAGRAGVKSITEIIAEEPDVAGLERIQARVLLIWSREDRILPYYHWTKFIAALPAGASLRSMEGCGHAPHLERPEETAAIMLEFLGAGD